MVTGIFAPATFKFGGVTLDRQSPGNDPKNLWLADGIHAGTIGQGMLANLFVIAANEEFNTRIRPLSDREILRNADVRHGNGHAAHENARRCPSSGSRRRLFSDVEIPSRQKCELAEA